MTEHTHSFDTDVARLLDIVAGALYTNQDVFLRELISNAADACDKLRYEAVSNSALSAPDKFRVHITKDTNTRTLTLSDNGIGMNDADLKENLGTIARSGTAKMMAQIQDKKDLNLIGQFGVGFYASFMVAHKVEVISRKAGDTNTWFWESDGRTGYSLRPAASDETKKLMDGDGTAITLYLKDTASDFLIPDKIKQVILNWSDHINIPVFVEDDENPINAASALWTQPKNQITAEQYSEFYHHIGHVFDEPTLTTHWTAEGKIEFTALLFIPSMRPWDLYDPSRKNAVRLYVKRVYITDKMDNLVYPWLRFLRGIIDSQDIPLNISREMLQTNPVVEKIRAAVTRKILSELHALSQKDDASFKTFWHQFGAVVKEGLYDAAEHREDIFKICRFFSTHGEDVTSLADYISRMKDGQDSIYYITGEKPAALRSSPQIEGFKAKGLEVLFFTDTIDSFWLQMASDYMGKKFISVTKGDINLDQFESTASTDKKESSPHAHATPIEPLIEFLRAELAYDVGTVRVSKRLTDSPVCLVADEKGVDMHMERVLKIQQKYDPNAKRVLEINATHPLILKLSAMAQNKNNDVMLKNSARLLFDQAMIIQGEPISDPAAFARRMAEVMEKGLAA